MITWEDFFIMACGFFGKENAIGIINRDNTNYKPAIIVSFDDNAEKIDIEDVLAEFLETVTPEIPYLKFRKLTKLICVQREQYKQDYYDEDYTWKTIQSILIKDLYDEMKKCNLLNFSIEKKEGYTPHDVMEIFRNDAIPGFTVTKNGIEFCNTQIKMSTHKMLKKFAKDNKSANYCVNDFLRNMDGYNDYYAKKYTFSMETFYVTFMKDMRLSFPVCQIKNKSLL